VAVKQTAVLHLIVALSSLRRRASGVAPRSRPSATDEKLETMLGAALAGLGLAEAYRRLV